MRARVGVVLIVMVVGLVSSAGSPRRRPRGARGAGRVAACAGTGATARSATSSSNRASAGWSSAASAGREQTAYQILVASDPAQAEARRRRTSGTRRRSCRRSQSTSATADRRRRRGNAPTSRCGSGTRTIAPPPFAPPSWWEVGPAGRGVGRPVDRSPGRAGRRQADVFDRSVTHLRKAIFGRQADPARPSVRERVRRLRDQHQRQARRRATCWRPATPTTRSACCSRPTT